MAQRLNAHGENAWSPAGGHLEFGETFAECALREVAEEVGITISQPRFITCTNDVFVSEQKHYVTIIMRADWEHGEPKDLEPHKMIKWAWFRWDDLPSPLFLPIQQLVDSGFRP